jgi:hypothetical protein
MFAGKSRGASGVQMLSVRTRIILTGALLVLSLICTVFATRATVSAFQSFQQENQLMKQGDVHTIRPWMTVPYIARVCQVPESYLYDALHLPNSRASRHMTLQEIATRDHTTAEKVIRTVQNAITLYREHQRGYSPPHLSVPASFTHLYSSAGRAML